METGSKALDLALKNWMEWDNPQSETYGDVKRLIEAMRWDELSEIMLKRLAFGTAGIRGKMGPGFGRMNDLVVIQTTQGLARYLLEVAGNDVEEVKWMGAVIGYDARFNSNRWAKLAAGVFIRMGFKVYLFSRITPTPFVPFTVVRKAAAVGIMITASHNPKEDNGYKVFWRNGPQIVPPHDKNIQKSILAHLAPEDKGKAFDEESEADRQLDLLDDTVGAYFDTLEDILYDKQSLNLKSANKIVYSAMHGVGAVYIDMAFERAGFRPVIHVKQQRDPDPTFPTVVFPNPEEGKSALDLSIKTADANGATYILANDPDADRLGVAQKRSSGEWKIFTGNELGALIGWWQFKVMAEKLATDVKRSNMHFIASSVSSKMLASIAKKEGMTFDETSTGFKYMANRAYDVEKIKEEKHVTVLAFEQAIGYMCGSQVLDKDGVSAAVRVAELIAYLDLECGGWTMADKLEDLYRTYGYHCSNDSYFLYADPTVLPEIFDPLRHFDGGRVNTYPKSLGNGRYEIVAVRDLSIDHPFDSSCPDKKPRLPLVESCEALTFTFQNGITATLRTSGTEPKLKYYTEFCASPEVTEWSSIEKELAEFVEVFVSEFVKPKERGLI